MRALGLILALLSLPLHSQDERVVKKMIENIRETNQESPSKHSFFNAHSPLYKLDINDDGRVESIVLEKKDNEDWIHIHDYKRRRFFSAPFVPKGTRSGVYKINRRVISKDTYVLLIHYYEGYTRYLRLQGTARLYIIAIPKNDLTSLAMARGPIIFEEKREQHGHYHRRSYSIHLEDFDNDGVREISVRHNRMSRVLTLKNGFQFRES